MRIDVRTDGEVTGCTLDFDRDRCNSGCLFVAEVAGPALRIGYGRVLGADRTVALQDYRDVTDPAELVTLIHVIEGYLERHVPIATANSRPKWKT